jgi:hypothetical protein
MAGPYETLGRPWIPLPVRAWQAGRKVVILNLSSGGDLTNLNLSVLTFKVNKPQTTVQVKLISGKNLEIQIRMK